MTSNIPKSLGMGTFTGKATDQEDEYYYEAVKLGLQYGIKKFDTAHNYRQGRSEILLGKILSKVQQTVEVTSKVGFVDLPPEEHNMASFVDRYCSVKINDSDLVLGCHCIHPDFVRYSVEESIKRLNRPIHRMYIHNPETQLIHCSMRELEKKLCHVMEILEEKCSTSELKGYGVATWNAFICDPKSQYYLSIERLSKIAHTVAGPQNKFTSVMFPLNYDLPDAAIFKTQSLSGDWYTVLECSKKLGLEINISAPLGQNKSTLYSINQSLDLFAMIASCLDFESVLVGMRKPENIKNNINLLSQKHFKCQISDLFKALNSR